MATALRADAARNVERILEAALHALAEDPAAGMGEIATAAGVGRATLYRHFPLREDLIAAIRELARSEAMAAIEAARPDEGPAGEALLRLVRALLRVSDRFRVLAYDVPPPTDAPSETQVQIGALIEALVRRGQREGEFSRRVPVAWAARSWGFLMLAAIREIADGRADEARAARLVASTWLDGVRAERPRLRA